RRDRHCGQDARGPPAGCGRPNLARGQRNHARHQHRLPLRTRRRSKQINRRLLLRRPNFACDCIRKVALVESRTRGSVCPIREWHADAQCRHRRRDLWSSFQVRRSVFGARAKRGFTITNYGEFLDQHQPIAEVEINNGADGEGTSWSCAHGVGRWIRHCGCHTGGEPGWDQKWRKPLRDALDFLRDENIKHFEATRGSLFIDPWQARDDSITLILDSTASREAFIFDHAGRWYSREEQERALTYLELQRMLLLMYTSCGWFFSDIAGIETIQILKYAARAIDLMEQLKLPSARDKFLEIMAEARSNRREMGTAADIFRRFVEPSNPNLRATN